MINLLSKRHFIKEKNPWKFAKHKFRKRFIDIPRSKELQYLQYQILQNLYKFRKEFGDALYY